MKEDDNKRFLPAERVAWLIAGFLRQTLSEKEHDELDEWVGASDENLRLFEELTDPGNIEKGLKQYSEPDTATALKKAMNKAGLADETLAGKKRKRALFTPLSIAASIVLLTGTIIFLVLNQKKNKPGIVQIEKKDLSAGGNRATLTLTNGKVIDLANAKNGLIDSTNGSDVLKAADGQLSYESNLSKTGEGFHILTTPAGGQYKVTLPEGTRVWLNAGSKLKYPVRFDDEERVVELEGEGYFEVRPLPKSLSEGEGLSNTPFIVKLRKGTKVEVKGTHFNINAYEDEKTIETVLLEGKVEVSWLASPNQNQRAVNGSYDSQRSTGGNQKTPLDKGSDIYSEVLKPGQKSNLGVNGEWSVVDGADTSMTVAWKNGKFQFKDATIEMIMRQVARWYDAIVVYEGKIDYHFNVTTIYRNEPLSVLLKVLEATKKVKFEMEGKKVIVREW